MAFKITDDTLFHLNSVHFHHNSLFQVQYLQHYSNDKSQQLSGIKSSSASKLIRAFFKILWVLCSCLQIARSTWRFFWLAVVSCAKVSSKARRVFIKWRLRWEFSSSNFIISPLPGSPKTNNTYHCISRMRYLSMKCVH